MSIELWTKTKSGWLVKPDIEFFQFPGGEWHLKGGDYSEFQAHYAIVRGGSADDIVKLLLWQNFLERDGLLGDNLHAFIPYLPGARADRGKPFGAGVYMSLLDNFEGEVYYMDPHSKTVVNELRVAVYHHLTEIDFAKVAARTVAGRSGLHSYIGVIAPDKGAHDRAQRVGNLLEVPTYFAQKTRDFASGALSGFEPPAEWDYTPAPKNIGLPVIPMGYPKVESTPPTEGRYLVVDDICDGGGTFMGLASVLGIPRENLDLWVTHGVFSGRAAQLKEAYGNIYTTDSHPGARNEDVGAQVTNLLPYFMEGVTNGRDH